MDRRGPDSNRSGRDDFVRDADGRPLLDRFGRPVRRRSTQTPPPSSGRPRVDREHADNARADRGARPQQYIPPRQNERPTKRPAPRPTQQPPVAPGYVGNVVSGHPMQPIPGVQGQQYRPQASMQPPIQPPAQRKVRMARPSSSKPGKKLGCTNTLSLLVLALVTILVVGTLWADAKLNRVDATPNPQVANTKGTNWLLVGSDSRQGLTEEQIAELNTGGDIGVGRTDTIMVLHMPAAGEATLVSIPRDSYVSIPGYGQDKINAAFTIGGPQLLTATVEQATGLRIDHYAEIGFGGFSGIVDSVGGVNICVKEQIDDEVINLHLPAGCQDMDGPTALSYVRTRSTAMGDLDRVERQRAFFAALMKKSTSFGTLANPFRTIPLINKVSGTFTVGENDHAWHLARLALAIRGGVKTETVPIGGFADYDVGNVVLWDKAKAIALFDSMK